MSIHLAESEDEVQFIQSARGDWADFLSERGIDFSGWRLPAKSPVQYLEGLNVLDSGTLAVHLLHCSEEDMQLLRERNTSICFCPRSNFLLHGKLPDIPGFLLLGFRPCLGTDSLASSPSLSILDEMAFVFHHYDGISPADIFAMGTVYGAAALGIENRFGRLAPGFAAPPFYVDIDVDSHRDVLPAVVNTGNAKTEGPYRKSET
jgi:cytosine/adenosine deaminase-related metal-dependent hydrolase